METRNSYTADRRIYRNAAGALVEADDPTRLTLVIAEGQTIPRARAEQLGLVGTREAPKASDKEAEKAAEKEAPKAANKNAPKAENKKG